MVLRRQSSSEVGRTCSDGHRSCEQPVNTMHNVHLEVSDDELPDHDSEAAKGG
jgi:hypothetical protein